MGKEVWPRMRYALSSSLQFLTANYKLRNGCALSEFVRNTLKITLILVYLKQCYIQSVKINRSYHP